MNYALLYVFIVSLIAVSIEAVTKTIAPALLLFGMTVVAIVFFHSINLRHLRRIYTQAWQNAKGLFFTTNLLLLVNWVGNVYGIYYSNAVISKLAYYLVLGISAMLASQKEFRWLRALCLLCLIVVVKLLYHQHWLGIVLSGLGGVAALLYGLASAKLQRKATLTPSQVLCLRFWAIFIAMPFLFPAHVSSYLTLYNIMLIILVGLFAYVVQVYVNQKAIACQGAVYSGVMKVLIPMVTFLFSAIFYPQSFAVSLLIISCLLVVVCKYDVLLSFLRKK